MNALLDQLAGRLEEAEAGCAAVREREAALRRELEADESLDRGIRETMLTAHREIDRMEAEARRESEALRERARIEALEIEATLEEEHEAVAASLADVRAIEAGLRAKTRELVEEALRELMGTMAVAAAEVVEEPAPPRIEQTQPIPVLPPPAARPEPEPAQVPEEAPEPDTAEDTLGFGLPVAEEDSGGRVSEAAPASRRPFVLSFAILLVGALVAVGIWQLSSADGASQASASPGPAPAPESAAPVPEAETTPEEAAVTETPVVEADGPAPVEVVEKAALVIEATRGDCWLQVRAGSANGRLLYDGFLYQGDQERFSARRLWVRFGNPANVTATLGGQPVDDLPAGTGDVVVTAAGVKTVSLG